MKAKQNNYWQGKEQDQECENNSADFSHFMANRSSDQF